MIRFPFLKGSGRRKQPVWHKFTDHGYVTATIDNSCMDWSGRYQQQSSKVEHQFVAPFCLDDSHPLVDPHGNTVLLLTFYIDVFNGPFSIRRRCMAGRYVHQYVMDYLKQFWKNYDGLPRFVVTFFNEGHESTGEVIGLLDDDIHSFFAENFKNGVRDLHFLNFTVRRLTTLPSSFCLIMGCTWGRFTC